MSWSPLLVSEGTYSKTNLHLSQDSLISGGLAGRSASPRKTLSSSSSSSLPNSAMFISFWTISIQAQRYPKTERSKWRPWRRKSAAPIPLLWARRIENRRSSWTKMKLHQVLTGAANTLDEKAAIAVGSVEDHPFTVSVKHIRKIFLEFITYCFV